MQLILRYGLTATIIVVDSYLLNTCFVQKPHLVVHTTEPAKILKFFGDVAKASDRVGDEVVGEAYGL